MTSCLVTDQFGATTYLKAAIMLLPNCHAFQTESHITIHYFDAQYACVRYSLTFIMDSC